MNNSPTVLEIHSKAIQHNLQYFQSKLQDHTKTLVVIKAFSYGSDAIEIAKILVYLTRQAKNFLIEI